MTEITPDQQESLASAYEALSSAGDTITIASLRSAAGVSQNVAAGWLRQRRDAEAAAERAAQLGSTPAAPEKIIAAHTASLEAIWAEAVAAARTEAKDLYQALLDDEVRARGEADERADQADQRADDAADKADRLAAELGEAKAALADLRSAQASWTEAAEAARAEAKAAAETLSETQTALVRAQETQAATTTALSDLRAERTSWAQAAEVARTEARDATSALAEARGELTALRAVLAQQTEAPAEDGAATA
ncbi:hypothetical protein [Gordonia malaquae]|uniref:hypothetical protein n=1 Tax=Gordonia malaquae TaxID=410332 RepID=UPI0030FF186B